MGRFVNVGKVDVARGTGKLVFIEGLSIALLNSDGAFYGLENRCPLDGASLSDGFIAGSLVSVRAIRRDFFCRPASVSRSRRRSISGATEYDSTSKTFMLTWDTTRRRKKAKTKSQPSPAGRLDDGFGR